MLVGVVRTVGASRGATGGVVTEGVDVHAALGVGVVARELPRDGGGLRLGGLLEGDGALDLRVTTDLAHCRGTWQLALSDGGALARE